jgi:selenocysteine lyase/cysteine desulfurase
MLTCRKDLFSLPATSHYLNCAYMSPLSRRVVEAGIQGIRRKTVPYEIEPRDFFTGADRVRSLFARLVNASDPTRIAMVPSASYGLAQAARNTLVESGQKIVIADEQFPSNVYIWRRLAVETGARVQVVRPPVGATGRAAAWNASMLDAVDGDTAIVALGHVHWTDGTRFDLEAVRGRAAEVGAALIIDGTQSVGAFPFDLARVQPDALVCAGYKWLMGPYSLGVAYYGPRYDEGVPLEETWMGRVDSEDFSGLVRYVDVYRPGAGRYDTGEASNFALMPMLGAALEQLLEWGPANIDSYGRALTEPFLCDLRNRGFQVTEDDWRGGHLFGIRLPSGVDLTVLQAKLREKEVYVSVRGSAVRVSVHVYNDAADLAALGEVLLDGLRG